MARNPRTIGPRKRRSPGAHEARQPNWDNRTLFHGDNLPIMRGMDSATVDLIYLDPPFKKGKDFHATPDTLSSGAKFQDRWSWQTDVQPEWLEKIKDDWPAVWEVIDAANAVCMRRTKKNLARPRDEVGSDMGAYLCFMAVRLMEMQRILKPTGSIYLHCDHSASHYLKAVMDAIFGRKNFVNEVVWCYTSGGVGKRWWARKHDILLLYANSEEYTFNMQYRPYSEGTLQRGLTQYKKNLNENYELREEGAAENDWWVGIQPIVSPTSEERYGYPTQKPLSLLDRVIQASSNEDDMVLDPFCGCATTPIAAERAGRQWVGIDIWDKAHQAVVDRLVTEQLMPPDGDRRGGDLFPVGQIQYQTNPPNRRDGGGEAAPFLPTPERRNLPKEPWQRMNRAAIFQELADAQSMTEGLVLCAGCGRELEAPFMELDHITPRSDRGENDISNRILLCRPCNGRKNANLTMRGLIKANQQARWMQDERRAKHARDLAQARYEEIRYGAKEDG